MVANQGTVGWAMYGWVDGLKSDSLNKKNKEWKKSDVRIGSYAR